jgi:predicted ATPase
MSPFIYFVDLQRQWVNSWDAYPYNIPAIRSLERLELHPKVTYFLGENGSGKSTLLEAIACADGFNPEGGSRNFNFTTRDTHSDLWKKLRLSRGSYSEKRGDGFFLRAETFYNVATEIDKIADGIHRYYGGGSMHHRSHGESFFTLLMERFHGNGLYLLDEPESALSPQRQLSFLVRMHDLVQQGCQFLIATHSPILLAYPDSQIMHFTEAGIEPIAYEDTEHYQVTRTSLLRRESMLAQMLGPG